jgi:hypothetical protein
MGTEFKLVDNKRRVLYEGYMAGDRLERADIQVDNDTYLDIMSRTEYILWGDYIYNFERYCEETMTPEEKDKPVHKYICDTVDRKMVSQRDRLYSTVGIDDCNEQDFWDYCEYIKEHQDC